MKGGTSQQVAKGALWEGGEGLDQDPTRVQVLCVLLQQCHHDPANTPLQCHCNATTMLFHAAITMM